MILNLYEHVLSFQEVGGDLSDRLKKMGVYHLFAALDKMYEDKSRFNAVLFYIIRIYSYTSDELVIGSALVEVKEKVFKELELPEEMVNDVIKLQNGVIAATVYSYLEYQERVTFKHYMCTVDLYNQMLEASLSFLLDGNDQIDYQKKFNCSEYAEKLSEKIKKWENYLIQDYGKLKDEKKKAKENSQVSYLGIENYIK